MITARRLFGINAFAAWFGYGVAEVANAFHLVPSSEPYVADTHMFGGSAAGLAGAPGCCVRSSSSRRSVSRAIASP